MRGRDTRSFYEDELNACRRYSHVPSSSPQPASTVDLAAGSKRCLSSRAAPLSVLARVGPSSRMLTSRCGCAGWQTARGWQSSWVWRARTCTSCGAIRFEVRALSSGECDSKLLRPSCAFSSSSSSPRAGCRHTGARAAERRRAGRAGGGVGRGGRRGGVWPVRRVAADGRQRHARGRRGASRCARLSGAGPHLSQALEPRSGGQ